MKKLFLLFTLPVSFILFSPSTEAKAQCKTEILSAFGGISAMTIYNTYLVIGMAGDSFEWEKMTGESAAAILNEQVGFITNVSKSLQESLDVDAYDEQDTKFVKEMIYCFSLLESQARALLDYIEEQTTENADKFQYYREKAWDKITELLGL